MVETVGARLGPEVVKSIGVDGRGGAALMASGTFLLRGKQTVGRGLAVGRRAMAIGANGACFLEMKAVGEARLLGNGVR